MKRSVVVLLFDWLGAFAFVFCNSQSGQLRRHPDCTVNRHFVLDGRIVRQNTLFVRHVSQKVLVILQFGADFLHALVSSLTLLSFCFGDEKPF